MAPPRRSPPSAAPFAAPAASKPGSALKTRARVFGSASLAVTLALLPGGTVIAQATRPRGEPPVQPARATAPALSPSPTAAPWTGPSAAAGPNVQPGQTPASSATREPTLELPPEPPARELTLTEVLTIAQRDPPAVLSALAAARVAEAQVNASRTAFIPTVSGNANAALSVQNGSTFNQGVYSANNLQGAGTLSASISAQWLIWDFGRVNANARAAERALEGSRADAREAVRAAVGQASVAFFQLLSDHQLAESAREIVRQRERQLDIARGLVDAGARPPIERTRAEVSLDTARLDLLSAQTSMRTDAATLALALALDPAIPLRPVSPGGTVTVDDDPAHAGQAAERGRNDLVSARARVAQAQEQLEAARAAYRPTLSLNGSIGARLTAPFSASNAAVVGTSSTPSASASRPVVFPSENAQVGLSLSVPIYDASIPAQVRTAEAQLASAQATLVARTTTVRAEAVQAAISVRSSRVALAQAERLAAGAAANLAQAEGRYSAGAAPLLELVDAQASDATARVAVVRARVSFELAKVRLLSSVGRLDDLEQRTPTERDTGR